MTRKKVILITGPTASGKSALALTLAASLNTQIISADSRQCFRELNIGTAKPSPDELSSVRHYFINSHSINEPVNAGTFEAYALDAVKQIFIQQDIAIMVGGTGLYIKAFCEGLDQIPPVSDQIRQQIVELYNQKGIDWLKKEMSIHDPVYYDSGETQNPQRLMRALEVKLSTGRSIREFQQKATIPREFDIVKYAIDLPREKLYDHINSRVERMMQQGLLEEVRSLLPQQHLNALQTVGYAELFDYLLGKTTLDSAVERIKLNTRHYAKRQMTWFRKDPGIQWIKEDQTIKI